MAWQTKNVFFSIPPFTPCCIGNLHSPLVHWALKSPRNATDIFKYHRLWVGLFTRYFGRHRQSNCIRWELNWLNSSLLWRLRCSLGQYILTTLVESHLIGVIISPPWDFATNLIVGIHCYNSIPFSDNYRWADFGLVETYANGWYWFYEPSSS